MNNVVICFASYSQPQVLLKWWEAIREWPQPLTREHVSLHYCDDHSTPPTEIPEDIRGLLNGLKHSRSKTDIPWNQFGCANRNVSLAADDDYLWLTDADAIPSPDGIEYAVTQKFNPKRARKPYLFHPEQPGHDGAGCNFFFLRKSLFDMTGGYDQGFAGHYGYADNLFYNTLVRMSGAERTLDRQLRIRFWTISEIDDAGIQTLDRDLHRNCQMHERLMKQPVTERIAHARMHYDISGFETVG